MQASIKEKIYNNRYSLTAILFIVVGIAVRVVDFGRTPGGLSQDEAFAAYEAFSLLNYGVDSAGNVNPTYFVSWGSGMNVLESYLAIPFMWLFGYSEAVFRLPSLITAIATLPVFWLTLKKLFGNFTAIIGLGVLATSPWHIMLSRFGLESNLAPAFLLFGFYFLLKGMEKNPFFLLSAFFYGLSLYSYSMTWLTVPLMLIIFGVYILKKSKDIKPLYVIASAIILLIFALPHILFLFVNYGILPEIKTSFFTIPQLVAMREYEISVLNIFNPNSWLRFFKILFLQYDNIPWNSSPYFGMFYLVTVPFFVIGFVRLIIKLISDIKSKKISGAYFILGGFFSSALISLMIFNLNVNKSNSLHLFTASIIAVGICYTVDFIKQKKAAIISILTVFTLCFACFCGYYFGGKSAASEGFADGIGQAVELVKKENCEKVALDRYIYHSHILYYDKTPPKTFLNTVDYEVYPYPYLKAKSFGRYFFEIDYNTLGDYDGYIFPVDHLYFFSDMDFEITTFNEYAVAIRK